jgi:hypothetical protein
MRGVRRRQGIDEGRVRALLACSSTRSLALIVAFTYSACTVLRAVFT